MALPAVGQQNALQVGMSIETDAKHVIHFALQPVRSRPDGNYAGRAGAVSDHRLDAHALIALEGVKNPDQIELLLPLRIVQGGDVDEVIELFLIAENLEQL